MEAVGRERADYTARYPELDVLRRLPAGTLVDGELVTFDAGGRPDLRSLLRRHGLTDAWRIRQARRWCSVRYVLFDLLYHAGRCLMGASLVRRDYEATIPPKVTYSLTQRGHELDDVLGKLAEIGMRWEAEDTAQRAARATELKAAE